MKLLCLLTIIRNIYFNMNIVDYPIFMSLLRNHKKKCNFVKYGQFILIFPVVGTAILLTTFPTLLKSYFLLNNITRDYSNKWKIKKQKLKIITRPIKKNYKKNCDRIV